MRQFAPALLVVLAAVAQPPPRRVVLIDLDGLRQNIFDDVFRRGRLPQFERIIGPGYAAARRYVNATTVFPSVTLTGHASMFTGTWPGRHGIAGNHWYEAETGREWIYVTPAGIGCVYGVSIGPAPECRGGLANRHLLVPTVYEAAAAAGKTSFVVFSHYWRGATEARTPTLLDALNWTSGGNFAESFDRKMADHAIDLLRSRGLPDILTVYFEGTDEVGHEQGAAAQGDYLARVVDRELGRVLDQVELLDRDWQRTMLFIIVADHGQHAPDPDLQEPHAASRVAAILAGLGFDSSRYKLAGNGGMAYLYLFGASGEEQAVAAQRLSLDPALARVLAFAAVREGGSQFAVYQGGERRSIAVIPPAWFRLLARGDSDRNGNLVLALKPGSYFGAPSNGADHGGLHPDELSIPLILARGGIPPGLSAADVDITAVAGTVADYLGFRMPSASPALPGYAGTFSARADAGGETGMPARCADCRSR